MKKSTKLLILTAILGLGFTLTACNFSANNTDKNKKKTTNTNTPTNTPSGESPVNPDEELEAIELPLTLQAITNGNIIISGRNAFEKMQIQKNDGLIIDATENVFVQAGDKIRFYASGYKYKTDGSNNLRINSTADCYVYGNAMSLVYYTDFAGKTELTEKYVLQKLFVNNSHIKNYESLDVVLPATTLSESCYKMMFYGCTGITRAPELPAVTLTKDCYNRMFYNCSNLNSIKCMAADISAWNCTTNWLANVSATGNFTSIQENSIWKVKDVYSGIPRGWITDPPFVIPNAKEIPLTIEVLKAGQINLDSIYLFDEFMYSINDGEKTDVTTYTIPVNAGDKVCFFAKGPGYVSNTPLNIKCTSDCYIYGNIMSLIASDNFSSATEIPKAKSFYHLFYDNAYLKNCAIELLLPATKLEDNCYERMFEKCTQLTIAPELPAENLTESCYEGMFYNCINLTEAPELPATTMQKNCYKDMFYNCQNLTTAPELPATTLAESCYNYMFQNCLNLTTAPELSATTLAKSCYKDMFYSCQNLTAAPELPAREMADSCYNNMFYNCTSLAIAPDLPATTLADSCYYGMFQDCTSLTSAPVKLPATTLAESCYKRMFYNCRNLTAAPVLPATKMENSCYDNMFYNCKNITAAPELPAKELASYCYSYMFENCSNLTIAPVLPADELKTGWDMCYNAMFRGCSKLRYVDCKVEKIKGNTNFSYTDLDDFCNYWLWNTTSPGILVTPSPYSFTNTVAPHEDWKKEKYLPLTIEAVQDGTITINNTDKFNRMSFYKNYNQISNISQGLVEIDVTAGDKIWIFGNGLVMGNTENTTKYLNITCNSYCYIYGSVMSLVTEKDYGYKTEIPSQYYFIGLFEKNDMITNHPKEPLELPATTLKVGCYYKMFAECSRLSAAPALPATELEPYCYEQMFHMCSNLTSAPELSAMTMKTGCYDSMFSYCTRLREAPALPATSLAHSCYGDMFYYCNNLETAPALPAETLVPLCYFGMFYHCLKLERAPDLLAEALAEQCYYKMFEGCVKLKYIKCLAKSTASNALKSWTYNVSDSGTFVKNSQATFWVTGPDGIPSRWTQSNASQ